jgi:dihydroflavonol-4-reductase
LIVPAREGTLRVLRAARDAGVRRLVLTSSFAAIGYGQRPRTAPFDETDWTNLDQPDLGAYAKSKTLAERAAWDFVAPEGGNLKLSVINPVGVLGPVLGPDLSASIRLIKRMLDGAMPGHLRLWLGIVDVRDVADLHVRTMTDPGACGERFLAVAGDFMSPLDVAKVLKHRLGRTAAKVPARQFPDWMVRVAAIFNPDMREVLPELGKRKNARGDKARRLLGWSPRASEEAIVAAAESLVRSGLVNMS